MSAQNHKLREIVRLAGLGPSLDGAESWHELGFDLLDQMADVLDRTATAYAQLFPADPTATPSPTVDALEAMLASNPHKATAFLQALLSVTEAQALMMVWRILHGDEIVSVSVKYHESDRFELVVDLRAQGGGGITSFQTHDITCAPLLGHFGIIIIDGQPAFSGFYAHRI